MNVLVSLACFAAVLVVCSAHLCLVEPRQRGSMMMLNKAGADDCILLTAPCGGRPAEMAQTIFKAGGNFSVVFQKNLDHWAMATPGYFSVMLMQGTMMPKELARVMDMGEPSLHLYMASGMVPMVPAGDYVLQVIYMTKNPQAPPAFYQCADVKVTTM